MRTLLMVVLGLLLAFAFDRGAAALRKRRSGGAADGAGLFILIWLAVTGVDFWVGVDSGHLVRLEMGVHLLIFALPAALAWYLSRRRPAARAAAE